MEVALRLPDLGQASTDRSITKHDGIRVYCQSGVDFLTDLDFQSTRQIRKSKYNLSLVIFGTQRPAATSCPITQDVLIRKTPII